MPDLRDFGTKIRITLKTGEPVEGWFLGALPHGLYLAMDSSANIVRFFPDNTWVAIHYLREADKAPFVPPDHEQQVMVMEALAEALAEPVRAALGRVDHNRIKRLAIDLLNTRRTLEHLLPTKQLEPHPFYEPLVIARNTHMHLLDEVRSSGLEDLLRKYAMPLRQAISRETLPQIDAQVLSLAEIDEMIGLTREQDLLSDADFGRQWIDQPISILINIQIDSQREETSTPDHVRLATGWIKVLAGGTLAAANLGIGIFAGVVAGLPTLGWGMVPIGIAIAESVFTGLNAAADALRDMSKK